METGKTVRIRGQRGFHESHYINDGLVTQTHTQVDTYLPDNLDRQRYNKIKTKR